MKPAPTFPRMRRLTSRRDVSQCRQVYNARNVFPLSLSQSRFLKNHLETCSGTSERASNFRNHKRRTLYRLSFNLKIFREQLPTCWYHCRLIARILPRMCIVYIYSWVPLGECKQNFSANMKWHGRFLRLRLAILRRDYVFTVCVLRGITRGVYRIFQSALRWPEDIPSG